LGESRIIIGDALETLRTLPDESVNCCVTSPPYWGLRDYGTAQWDGGDPACDHRHKLGGEGESSEKQNTSSGTQTIQYRGRCQRCGAVRTDRQLGLEQTPEEYVGRLVEIFREVRRVLRDDGTLWLNLGDCYSGSWGNYGGQYRGNGKQREIITGSRVVNPAYDGLERFRPPTSNPPGLKPKDLCMIPARVALALQADGWWLRQDIIWAKPNPMPESVTDRCTKAHEYVFLLSKSERYYYNAEAIAELATSGPAGTVLKDQPRAMNSTPLLQSNRWGRKQEPVKQGAIGIPKDGTRNKRSVWTVATTGYKGAHFAVFPPEIPRLCIMAGSPPGGVVLDPFVGSGTTAAVALSLGRGYIGIELNPKYKTLIEKRLNETLVGLPL